MYYLCVLPAARKRDPRLKLYNPMGRTVMSSLQYLRAGSEPVEGPMRNRRDANFGPVPSRCAAAGSIAEGGNAGENYGWSTASGGRKYGG